MKKQTVIGLIVGVTLGTAATIAGIITVRKIVKEIKNDLVEESFISPNGDNLVTLTYGSSDFARGLTFIKVRGMSEGGKDDCKLIAFAKRNSKLFSAEWADNEHFNLVIGNGKVKQHCDVSFEGRKINALYYLHKINVGKAAKCIR